MLKSLLLILFVFSAMCFAQNENPPQELPVANKIEEFETATNGYVKMLMDSFYVELSNNPSSQGYIINYGLPRELSKRRVQIMNSIRFRKFDESRITFVDGGFRPKIKTEFWMVPFGAEPPTPQTDAEKVDEFEKVTLGYIKARIDNFYIQLANNPEMKGYILNYGTQQQIVLRNQNIKKAIEFRKYDLSKLIFINAGTSKTIKTEFWIDKKTP